MKEYTNQTMRTLTVLNRKMIPDWPDVWDLGFVRWDAWGFLEDCWDHFWRTFGEMFDGFSYKCGGFLDGCLNELLVVCVR